MEDIVLLETARMLLKETVAFRLTAGRSEFDMVIHTRGMASCEAYEVKHSIQIVPRQ